MTSIHFEELSSLQKSVAQTTYLFKLVEKRQEFCPIIPGKVNSLFVMWIAWWVIKKKNPWISPQGHTRVQWPPATMLIRYLYIYYISYIHVLFKAVESTVASHSKSITAHTHTHENPCFTHVPLKLACGQPLNRHWNDIWIQEGHSATVQLVWIYFLAGLQV